MGNTLRDLYTKLDRNHDYTAADAETLTGGNILLVQDPDGIWQPFVIRQPVTTMGETMVKTVQADHLFYELGDGQPKTYNLTNAIPSTAMTAALTGTRWQVGEIDDSLVAVTKDLRGEMLSPLARLRQIETEYEARLRFRCAVTDGIVTGLYVDLLEIDQEFSGQRFEFGHNLQNISIQVDYSEVKTALVGIAIGEEVDPLTGEPLPLTFKSAEWHKNNGDPADKPYGQDWVGDEEARQLYGIPDGQGGMLHRFGVHESQAETEEGLLQGTWTVLQRNCQPRITIQARVPDLEKAKVVDIETGQLVQLGHEKLRLGNICYVLIRHKGIVADTAIRLTSIVRHLTSPEATEVVFGDTVPLRAKQIKALQDWQRWANRRSGVWNKAKAFDAEGNLDVARTKIVRGSTVQNQVITTLAGADGILSAFQYQSVGGATFDDTGGWSNMGIVKIGGDPSAGRVIVFVHVPDVLSISDATLTIYAAPTYCHDYFYPERTRWKQSRNLKLYHTPFDFGYNYYVEDSGQNALVLADGVDITASVLGSEQWSPTLIYSGDDENNRDNKIQIISGDITPYLIAGQTAVFYVQTTDLPSPENFEHNQGLGKIVVTVKGYAR